MKQTPRLASIDCFRGFAVLAMVLASYLFGTEALPAWLSHAPDGSLTAFDFGAPLFIIAIGLTFGAALQRRWSRDGPTRALWHFLRRALLLFLIGLTMALIQTCLGRNEGGIPWGVLQAIAIAIVVTLLTLKLPPLPRGGRARPAGSLPVRHPAQLASAGARCASRRAAGRLRLGQSVDSRHGLRRPLLPLTPS